MCNKHQYAVGIEVLPLARVFSILEIRWYWCLVSLTESQVTCITASSRRGGTGRYTRYQFTSLEKNWKWKLHVELDLGIPVDLLDISNYK